MQDPISACSSESTSAIPVGKLMVCHLKPEPFLISSKIQQIYGNNNSSAKTKSTQMYEFAGSFTVYAELRLAGRIELFFL